MWSSDIAIAAGEIPYSIFSVLRYQSFQIVTYAYSICSI